MAVDEKFVDVLAEAMAKRELTVYGLAKEVGLSASMVRRITQGDDGIGGSADALRRIAKALGLDETRLIVLSAQLYKAGSLRWSYAMALGEIENLKAENLRLRDQLNLRAAG